MIGQRVHQYQITEKLGEGGMGVVYKAEDTRLRRTVALKFLHPLIVASPEDQERLVAEARAAAGLSHPNICTIYEINEVDGRVFIAMQYVEGSTLRDRVLSGHTETGEALRFLIEIADGLRLAHARGIVHRDMKSSNIMIAPPGRAVIMDFGLARPPDQGRADDRFSSRGTSAYMSPEQARGERVDQRTDIWSLGVVLYEMLAGQLPFRGDYEQAVLYSILNEAPRPLGELRPGMPAAVLGIVERCLQKDPAARFQTLDELILALRRAIDRAGRREPGVRTRALWAALVVLVALGAAIAARDFLRVRRADGRERVPIAVIDFNNETAENSLDGLSGMLITALEQSQRLSVMTRSRMFDLLKTLGVDGTTRIDESLGQRICESAGVHALVIPTIRRFGDLYTIDLKVLDIRQHKYVYTTKEEGRGEESIPHMIDAVARGIRVDLREATDAVARTGPVADVTTPDLAAYQAYFEGEEMLNRLDFVHAHKSFEEAIARDSTFALAYYRLAYTEWWSRGQVEAARRHVRYAIANLNRVPLKERFLVRALKAGLDEGFEAQGVILKEMRTLYPDDKEMLFGLGDAEFHSASYDSAVTHLRAALVIDPVMERALQHLTWTYMRLDRMPDALVVARRWVDVARSSEALQYLGLIQLELGDTKSATQSLALAKERDPKDAKVEVRMASLYFAEGDMAKAFRALDEADRMAEGRDGLALLESGSIRAGVLLPYLGRYREVWKTLDAGLGRAMVIFQDSSFVSGALSMKARLEYRAYSDRARAEDTMARARSVSTRYRDRGYWDSMIAYEVVTGDTTGLRRLLKSHGSDLPSYRHELYPIAALAIAGDCAAAIEARSHLGEDVRRKTSAKSLEFLIGHCQVASGDHEAAIATLRPLLDVPLLSAGLASFYAPAWYDLGRAYEGTGRASEALACYERVVAMWKDADHDLPLWREAHAARDRLAHTRSM